MTARVLILMLPAALVVCAAGQVPAPDAAAQEAVVSRIRKAALEYGDRLQNFTCTQITARSAGPSATGPQWKPLETQELEIGYFDHREHFKLRKVNGETTNLQKRIKHGAYFQGYGQFGSALQDIFNPKANATFEWDHAEAASEGGACVFRYRVPEPTSTIVIMADQDRVKVGHHGMVWANCESGAVTRFLTEWDLAAVRRVGRRVSLGRRLEVRYGPATIASQEFLLPQSAVDTALFYKTWTKAEVQFQQYRKYDANSTVKFDEEEIPPKP